MLLNDPVRYGKAESGAIANAFRSKERIENLSQVLRRNSFAGVYDGNVHFIVAVSFCFQSDPAAAYHSVPGIKDQVSENLLQFSGVSKNSSRIVRIILNDLNIRFPHLWFEKLECVVEKFVNVDLRGFDRSTGS